jgi:hypothetical protein
METIDNVLVKQAVVDEENTAKVPAPQGRATDARQSAQSASWTTNGMPD